MVGRSNGWRKSSGSISLRLLLYLRIPAHFTMDYWQFQFEDGEGGLLLHIVLPSSYISLRLKNEYIQTHLKRRKEMRWKGRHVAVGNPERR